MPDVFSNVGVITAAWFVGLAYVWARSLMAKQSPWPRGLVYALAGWPIVVNLASPRVVNIDDYSGRATVDVSEWLSALQIPAWIVTSILLAYLIRSLTVTGRAERSRAGSGVLWSFLLFSLAPILSAFVGEPGGGLTHALFRPQLVIACTYFAANQQPDKFLRAAKWGCFAYVAGSLFAALAAPHWALIQDEGPFAFPRLYGLASNANALGPVALMLLFLEYKAPSSPAIRWIGAAAALAVILLSQCKTIWVATVVSAVVIVAYRERRILAAHKQTSTRRWVVGAVALSVMSFAVLYTRFDFDEIRGSTLTGRTFLWDVAMEEWRAKPIFGYGPTLWDAQYRREKLGVDAAFAGHSHNMYVQQLAETGLVGFSFMAVFLYVLGTMAWKARHSSRGLSLAVFLYLVLRGITESALSLRALDESMFVGALVVAVLIVESARYRMLKAACSPSFRRDGWVGIDVSSSAQQA